jgi:hypothetical protein
VVEIWHVEKFQVAEVSNEGGTGYRVQLYPRPDGEFWTIDLAEFQEKLSKAKEELEQPPIH